MQQFIPYSEPKRIAQVLTPDHRLKLARYAIKSLLHRNHVWAEYEPFLYNVYRACQYELTKLRSAMLYDYVVALDKETLEKRAGPTQDGRISVRPHPPWVPLPRLPRRPLRPRLSKELTANMDRNHRVVDPPWLTEEVLRNNRVLLCALDWGHYGSMFPDVGDDEYPALPSDYIPYGTSHTGIADQKTEPYVQIEPYMPRQQPAFSFSDPGMTEHVNRVLEEYRRKGHSNGCK